VRPPARLTEDFEVLLVEDGSPDGSWAAIVRECDRDPRIRCAIESNFGQHPAITAALEHARGDFVVIMDCDLQDDPDYIPSLYDKCREGFDVVFARRRVRRFGWWKNLTARIYYPIFRWLAGVAYDPNIGSYSIISRRVVDAFLQFGDYRRGYVIVLHWLGFSRGYVDVEHRERPDGRSSYTAWQLMVHALTLTLTYSEKPLHLSIYIGTFLSLLSFVFGGWFIVRYAGQLARSAGRLDDQPPVSERSHPDQPRRHRPVGRIFGVVKHRPSIVRRRKHPASSPLVRLGEDSFRSLRPWSRVIHPRGGTSRAMVRLRRSVTHGCRTGCSSTRCC
jgi:dolichol-phosphate mannosyltransferase